MAAHTPAITRLDLGRRILTKRVFLHLWNDAVVMPELKNRDPGNLHSYKLESKLARAQVVAHSTAIRGSQVCGLSSLLSAEPDDGC